MGEKGGKRKNGNGVSHSLEFSNCARTAMIIFRIDFFFLSALGISRKD